MSTESAGEDDNFGTETSQHAIMRCLGDDRRNRVLAGLYMGRSDTALMVRQSALHVWKVGSTSNLLISGLKIIMSNHLCIFNLFSNSESWIYKIYPCYRPPTKLGKGNVFTGTSGSMSFLGGMGISGTRSLPGGMFLGVSMSKG